MQDADWFLDPDNEIAKRVQHAPSFESGICDESGYTLAERDRAELLKRGRRLAQWARKVELLLKAMKAVHPQWTNEIDAMLRKTIGGSDAQT